MVRTKNYFNIFRPHTSAQCFQTGYTLNGVPTFKGGISSACPGQSAPKGGQWFDVRVEVNEKKAKIYLAGKLVREVTSHYPAKGQGGVLVANGYKNVAYFRNFDITHYEDEYLVTSCVVKTSGISGNLFVLDANHGKWPANGFCSALNDKVTLNSKQYAVSAELFNKIGWNGINSGHLGLIYNAIDEKNYDFVYFRYFISYSIIYKTVVIFGG